MLWPFKYHLRLFNIDINGINTLRCYIIHLRLLLFPFIRNLFLTKEGVILII